MRRLKRVVTGVAAGSGGCVRVTFLATTLVAAALVGVIVSCQQATWWCDFDSNFLSRPIEFLPTFKCSSSFCGRFLSAAPTKSHQVPL